MSGTLDQLVLQIIKEQELIIGPLAWNEAEKVAGLKTDRAGGKVEFTDLDQKSVVDKLVARYERLFGRASHEVCKEAAASLIAGLTRSEVPASLLA